MNLRYHVTVGKDYLVFSAAHFITFNGDVCERLHGHNYRVEVAVAGPLDENQYVVDFIALRDAAKALCDELDHHVILPTQHPRISVAATDESVEARHADRRWVFPRGDCVLLPIVQTTAELLARWFAERLIVMLEERTGARPGLVRVSVDECYGQNATCELTT